MREGACSHSALLQASPGEEEEEEEEEKKRDDGCD